MGSRRSWLNQASSPITTYSGDPKPVLGWRAYYTRERVFSSVEYSWRELPSQGILGIVVFHEKPYRSLIYGGDWYFFKNGAPSATQTGEWGTWIDPPDVPDDVLKKSATRIDDFDSVLDQMMEDKTWP